MGTINNKATKSVKSRKHEAYKEEHSHLNYMGGASYDISNPLHNLRIAATSCFFGEPMYYQPSKEGTSKKRMNNTSVSRLNERNKKYLRETLNAIDPQEWREMSSSQLMESAIDKALNFDFEETLKFAVGLRRVDNIRVTPQVIVVRAVNHPSAKGSDLLRKYARQIIVRADEPSIQMAYHLSAFPKNKIPTRLKRVWADALEKFNEYQLAKYRMESRDVKTVDVVNICHPSSDAVSKLMKGELKTTNETWESIISAEGSNKASWEKAIDVMGHMALLRNLRNLVQHKVNPDLFIKKLVDGTLGGKQLPFRYYSAYNAIFNDASPQVLDAVENCLDISIATLPTFKGKVISLCDNSGSARGTYTSSLGTVAVSTIANLTGIITGKVSEEGYVGIFGNKLDINPVRTKSSIFDQLKMMDRIGGSIGADTENGIWLFWDGAIKEKEHWDNVFIYSDMQAGHGGLYGIDERQYAGYKWGSGRHIDVPKLIMEYRKKVNPNVNVFLVQVAGYQDTIIPEFYERTYILGGWSDSVLRFADRMINPVVAQPVSEKLVEPQAEEEEIYL